MKKILALNLVLHIQHSSKDASTQRCFGRSLMAVMALHEKGRKGKARGKGAGKARWKGNLKIVQCSGVCTENKLKIHFVLVIIL